MRSPIRRASTLVVAAGLLIAACGSDDSTSTADQTPDPTTTLAESGAAADHGGGHDHATTIDATDWSPQPTVTITAVPDAVSGVNVHVAVEGFVFAPQHASGDAIEGEGHAHLYVDGAKVARLYGTDFHLGDIEPGNHEISVVLNGNDHSPLEVDGTTVEAATAVTVPAPAGTSHVDPTSPPEPTDGDAGRTTFDVTVAAGTITGGGRQSVPLGSTVVLRVTSDVDEEVHLHGYDISVDVAAGESAELVFEATIPGIFEAEFEHAGIHLIEFEIS